MTPLDPLRFHRHYQNTDPGSSSYAGGSSFMERMSEAVASGMGTVTFLVASSAIIVAWVFVNHLVTFLTDSWHGLLHGSGFDPAPFILLNLVFSAVAFYTGALVIIAQKAQTRTDKANAGGIGPARRGSLAVSARPAGQEHRAHRADPRAGPATDDTDD